MSFRLFPNTSIYEDTCVSFNEISEKVTDIHLFLFFDNFFPQRKAHKGAHLGLCYKKSVCPCSKSHCEFTKMWELGFVSRPLDLFLQFGDVSDDHLVCVIGIFPILWVKPVLNTSLRFRKNGCHFSIIP